MDIGSDESNGTLWSVPSVAWRVSPSGNDANNGLTWRTAKKTVQAAVSSAQGSDEVWVAKGTYTENLRLGAGVSLYGGYSGSDLLRQQRDWRSNPTVLDGAGTETTVVSCPFSGCVIDGFSIRNGGNGVHVSAGAASITNNAISANQHYAIQVFGTASISHNSISHNIDGGIYVSGFQVDNAYAGGISTMLNNTVSRNGTGLVLANGTATIANNTISGNTLGVAIVVATVSLENTIIAFNGSYGVFSVSGRTVSTFSHNNAYANATGNYSGFTPPTGQGNVSVDPLFVDAAAGNYRLQSGSPCVDAGDDSVVTAGETDVDGRPRILGLRVDIGAYEYDPSRPAPFTVVDLKQALGMAGGLVVPSHDVANRLNVEAGSPVDIADAVRIARKVTGLEANP